MYNDYFAGAVKMGVRINLYGRTMSSPTGVTDTQVSRHIVKVK
jgi:hypothetical protein